MLSNNNSITRESSSSSSSSTSYLSNLSDRSLELNFSYPESEDDILIEPISLKTKAIRGIELFEIPVPLSLAFYSNQPIEHKVDHVFDKLSLSKSIPLLSDFAIDNKDIEEVSLENLFVPEKPLLLLYNNFVLNKDLNEIIRDLKDILDSYSPDIDYEFIEHQCAFNAVFIRGSLYTDFSVKIYKNTGFNGYLVEFQRLNKSSCGITFKNICEIIKSQLLNPTNSYDTNLSFGLNHFESISGDIEEIDFDQSEEEIEASMKEILYTAKEGDDDSRLEACRMICDLILQPGMKEKIADTNCVEILSTILKSDRSLLRQQAVFVLAQLSECQRGIEAILKAKTVLPILMSIIGNGPYYTAAMRRESARAIANVAAKKAYDILMLVPSEQMIAWKQQIEVLADPIVKERSIRTIKSLKTIRV